MLYNAQLVAHSSDQWPGDVVEGVGDLMEPNTVGIFGVGNAVTCINATESGLKLLHRHAGLMEWEVVVVIIALC